MYLPKAPRSNAVIPHPGKQSEKIIFKPVIYGGVWNEKNFFTVLSDAEVQFVIVDIRWKARTVPVLLKRLSIVK